MRKLKLTNHNSKSGGTLWPAHQTKKENQINIKVNGRVVVSLKHCRRLSDGISKQNHANFFYQKAEGVRNPVNVKLNTTHNKNKRSTGAVRVGLCVIFCTFFFNFECQSSVCPCRVCVRASSVTILSIVQISTFSRRHYHHHHHSQLSTRTPAYNRRDASAPWCPSPIITCRLFIVTSSCIMEVVFYVNP